MYDSYHVIICHYCGKYGHIAKNASKPPTCGKCASSLHMKHETVAKQKRNALFVCEGVLTQTLSKQLTIGIACHMKQKQVKPIGFEAPRGGAYNNRKHLKLGTPCS